MGYLTYISTRYGDDIRCDITHWIKFQRRLVDLKEQRTFLIKCWNEGLFPAHIQNFSNKFINHNLHHKVIFKFQNTIFNTHKNC